MAAAYASLVSLFNTLQDIQHHPCRSSSFDNNQIQSLLESICFLIDFMETCDNSCGSGKEAAEVLERRIACAAHSAEEVIESHVVDQILSAKTISSFLLDLQNAVEEMDFVRRQAIKVRKLQSGMEAEQPEFPAAASPAPPASSVKNKMMGFDGILFQLMDLLTGESSSRRVIPIVGMGGIGKTTLAENAFHRNSFVRHFDVRVWVTISQQYSVKEILLQLLSRQGMSTVETVDELGEKLHKKLLGRRYLIVLDDVWSVEAWDRIRLFLPDDGISGSRVVVTTRLQSVADCFGSPCLAMGFLDEEKSWDLFCEKAFAERGCPLELEVIGKKIVKKCSGLPLAIVVVAGHLGKASMTREYWENVANHMNSILKYGENEEQLLSILSLSYSHLPVHLKPCFLYIGTFPDVGWIYMSDVIELWIAEGFLKPNKDQTLEKVAEGYLKDLIARNLILVSRTRFANGDTGMCKTHDVLRELCLKVVEKEKFSFVLHTSRAAVRSPSHVRSLKYVGGQLPFDMKLSRVLINNVDRSLANEADGGFLEANFQQVNLRYLHCIKVDVNKSRGSLYLSPTISLLWNLQTIFIRGVYPLVIAPYEIWEMTQLRHLQFRHVSLPDPLPSHRANDPVLQNLHTLLKARNFKLSEEVCKRIPNIKKLSLSYHNFKSHYCPNNLDRLHKLESLACYFSAEREWRDFALSLTLPSSLEDLTLSNSRFDWEELTRIVGSLPRLEILSLDANSVTGSEWTPVHGKFLQLRKLTIQGCDDLVYWNAESSHFPVLEYVTLRDLSKLDEFPSGIGEIASLRYMALHSCSVSSAVSAMRMLTEQVEELGNEDLQLVVDFSGDDEKLLSFCGQVEEEFLRSNNVPKIILYSDEVCKRISNIKELGMTYSGYSMECDKPSSYCPHNLGRLHKLESLHCTLNTSPEWHAFAQALTFPSSLKKLSLWNVHLDWEEMTMKIGSLPLLEVVIGGAEWNPVEGGFPRLTCLDICGCDDLTYWNAESSHFPVLEDLSLSLLEKLDEFPYGIGEIPTIERIDLQICKMCLAVSALRIVAEQEHEHGNEDLQLCVFFWNDEERQTFNKTVQEEGMRSNNLKLKCLDVDDEVIKLADMIALM